MKCSLALFILAMSCMLQSCSSIPKESFNKKKVKIASVVNKKCEEKVKYFKLLSKLSTSKQSNLAFFRNNSKKDLCSLYLKKTTKIMNKHSGKIGIIFEDNPNRKDKDKFILEGILKSARKLKKSKSFIIKRIKLNNKSINSALSSFVFKNRVGLLITWGDKRLLRRIQKWQKGLNISTLFIDSEIKRSKNSFKIFPNRRNYTEKMITELKKKNIKRIVVLTPVQYEKSVFLKKIKKAFKKSNIKIVYDILYNPESYDSMDMACRKIFNINRFKRRGELIQITRNERKKANLKGFKLNRKLVFLPAEVNYDAIFIPDNFKIVNHFAKLFQYYKAPKMPLIGTYEWRSNELMKAKNPYLTGSIFVDFIGNPKKLPIFSKKEKRSISLNENLGMDTDFKLMGYYSGLIGQKAIIRSKSKRVKVSRKLRRMKVNDEFLNNTRAFKNNEFNWPSFLFEVNRDSFLSKN